MSLDDKLKKVLDRPIPDTDDEEKALIDDIKQAFIDEGYTPVQRVGYRPDKEGYMERFPKLMTGQEAFNLLRQAGLKGKALSTAREALNADY